MNLDIQQILTQIFAFLILLFILKRFAWKPTLTILDQRKERISKGLNDIEQAKTNLEALRRTYEERLSSIEDEARRKIAFAIHEGKSIANQIQEEARQKSQELLQKTKENLSLEVDKARVGLRDEIAKLVIETSEKLIGKTLDNKRQNELVIEFIDELANKR